MDILLQSPWDTISLNGSGASKGKAKNVINRVKNFFGSQVTKVKNVAQRAKEKIFRRTATS